MVIFLFIPRKLHYCVFCLGKSENKRQKNKSFDLTMWKQWASGL